MSAPARPPARGRSQRQEGRPVSAPVQRLRSGGGDVRLPPRLVLVLANLALAAGLLAYWLGAPAWPEPAPLPPDAAALVPQSPTQPAPDAAVVQAITERPLFSPTRSAAAGNGGAPSFQDFRLVGLLGSGQATVALLAHGDRIRRVRAGEQIDGWVLQGGDGRTARFSRGELPGQDLFMEHAAQKPAEPVAAATITSQTPPAPSAGTAAKASDAPPAADDNTVAARRARREARRQAAAN